LSFKMTNKKDNIIKLLPNVPKELVDAAKSRMLVLFIGAGISRLVGCPSWDGFASAVLEQLTESDPKVIDYHEKSLIDSIADPRKRLSIAQILVKKSNVSIDYESIFKIDEPQSKIYQYINSLECTFVTTNYDKLIKPEISANRSEKEWRFYNRRYMSKNTFKFQGNVIHLHGCVDDPTSMVITTKDYLLHYMTKEISDFLKYLFGNKIVLFLGYGLEETEILEYILKSGKQLGKKEKRLFILQGFFKAEQSLSEKLEQYYKHTFNAELIPFQRDKKDYGQQTNIIEKWAKELTFKSLELYDELKLMEEELDG
jgi:hypothetical protein